MTATDRAHKSAAQRGGVGVKDGSVSGVTLPRDSPHSLRPRPRSPRACSSRTWAHCELSPCSVQGAHERQSGSGAQKASIADHDRRPPPLPLTTTRTRSSTNGQQAATRRAPVSLGMSGEEERGKIPVPTVARLGSWSSTVLRTPRAPNRHALT
jgi:hypothetical protein